MHYGWVEFLASAIALSVIIWLFCLPLPTSLLILTIGLVLNALVAILRHTFCVVFSMVRTANYGRASALYSARSAFLYTPHSWWPVTLNCVKG